MASSRNFFRVDKIYCYANFFCYAYFLLFSDQILGAEVSEGGGGKLLEGTPPCPLRGTPAGAFFGQKPRK